VADTVERADEPTATPAAAAAGKAPWQRRALDFVLALPLRRLAVGVGALGLAVSGLFGGLDEVKGPRLTAVAPGVIHKGKPWNVTVTGARLVDRAPIAPRRSGGHFLAVRATVEVTADRSRRDLQDVLRLGPEKPTTIYLLRDNAAADMVHPGLPEDLVFFWELPPGAAAPATVEVHICGKKHRLDSLTGRRDWLDRAPRARVQLAVDDRRSPT
jgi:hypothetical protein